MNEERIEVTEAMVRDAMRAGREAVFDTPDDELVSDELAVAIQFKAVAAHLTAALAPVPPRPTPECHYFTRRVGHDHDEVFAYWGDGTLARYSDDGGKWYAFPPPDYATMRAAYPTTAPTTERAD